MAKIRIGLASGELTIEFADMKDLEDQLQRMDFVKIDYLLERKKRDMPHTAESDKFDIQNMPKIANDPAIISLLKISEHGEDAVKLAVFLAASGLTKEEVKKITGVALLSS